MHSIVEKKAVLELVGKCNQFIVKRCARIGRKMRSMDGWGKGVLELIKKIAFKSMNDLYKKA